MVIPCSYRNAVFMHLHVREVSRWCVLHSSVIQSSRYTIRLFQSPRGAVWTTIPYNQVNYFTMLCTHAHQQIDDGQLYVAICTLQMSVVKSFSKTLMLCIPEHPSQYQTNTIRWIVAAKGFSTRHQTRMPVL